MSDGELGAPCMRCNMCFGCLCGSSDDLFGAVEQRGEQVDGSIVDEPAKRPVHDPSTRVAGMKAGAKVAKKKAATKKRSANGAEEGHEEDMELDQTHAQAQADLLQPNKKVKAEGSVVNVFRKVLAYEDKKVVLNVATIKPDRDRDEIREMVLQRDLTKATEGWKPKPKFLKTPVIKISNTDNPDIYNALSEAMADRDLLQQGKITMRKATAPNGTLREIDVQEGFSFLTLKQFLEQNPTLECGADNILQVRNANVVVVREPSSAEKAEQQTATAVRAALAAMPLSLAYRKEEHARLMGTFLEEVEKKMGAPSFTTWLNSLSGMINEPWFHGRIDDTFVKDVESYLKSKGKPMCFVVFFSRGTDGALTLMFLEDTGGERVVRFHRCPNKGALDNLMRQLKLNPGDGVHRQITIYGYNY